jgi:hypothetical protein
MERAGAKGLGFSLEERGEPPLNRMLLCDLVPGGAAHAAGLHEGDVLVKVSEVDGIGLAAVCCQCGDRFYLAQISRTDFISHSL